MADAAELQHYTPRIDYLRTGLAFQICSAPDARGAQPRDVHTPEGCARCVRCVRATAYFRQLLLTAAQARAFASCCRACATLAVAPSVLQRSRLSVRPPWLPAAVLRRWEGGQPLPAARYSRRDCRYKTGSTWMLGQPWRYRNKRWKPTAASKQRSLAR